MTRAVGWPRLSWQLRNLVIESYKVGQADNLGPSPDIKAGPVFGSLYGKKTVRVGNYLMRMNAQIRENCELPTNGEFCPIVT